jgi:hypothetical protein
MASIQSTIFLSVLSGIITSTFIYLLIAFSKRVVIPWYQEITYKGVDICGTWYGKVEGGLQGITLDLHQSANQVTGTATLATEKIMGGHFEPLRIFALHGSIQDRFISLFANHRDKQRLGINSYLLEVIGDGRKLKGIFTYYSVTTSRIVSDELILMRDAPTSSLQQPNINGLKPFAEVKGKPLPTKKG